MKAGDKCTDATRQYYINKTIIDYQEKVACPECGGMYSRVRMESRINRSFCRYNVMLAKSQTIQSITYRRDDGSYETVHYDYYRC